MSSILDETRIEAFAGQIVTDVGATLGTALVTIGDRLGLYRAMADAQPVSAAELAARTSTHERYVREWLNAQAAGGYVTYDAECDRYVLPAEHAFVLADEQSPVALAGMFQSAAAAFEGRERVVERFRSGDGLGWHEHHHDLFDGTGRAFGANYRANLVAEWLPALDGVVERLTAGGYVADVGCGHGVATILMAQAFPASTFVGYDYHLASIEAARAAAAEAGVEDRVSFEVARADDYPGGGYDLIAFFDSLHDLGDPVGAAARASSALAPDGTCLIVEPFAGDSIAENLTPLGRSYYGFSTLVCTPGSLSQEGRAGLGTQAGERRLTEVLKAGGFTRVRRAAETPFNLVLEAKR
ncbi:class I SAM-dependent methyltransferase [Conexibacter stalactiti]|uniref:Class I SAM-dependent methyltransferase n=1 Tax=Conexibacter stalactiti TaxID=1940611 RepID=A0ABU4HVA0_9ACTN|nr:class I SAM-dependent methyltransferase [Conexibacter stalactiti]MDW5597114.1 class I SAM-dependent methyltransferase [Conexibacter stalactiti]MEC5037756.1 class I SAM-dependent methyltransferase [Conexibacter stalactiti]